MHTLPIYRTCAANPNVTAVLSEPNGTLRLYERGLEPDAPKQPYAIWQTLGGTPENDLDAAAKLDHMSIQVDVYALNPKQARHIASAIRKAIEASNQAYPTSIHTAMREFDSKLYRVGFDANWYINRD